MAFKFLDTHDVVEALQQQESTSRQRFQYLCDQFHEVLRRLPQPETASSETAAPETATPDPPPASATTSAAEAAISQSPAPLPAQKLPPDEPPARTRNFDLPDWGPVVLGPQLAGDPALAAGCQALVAGLLAGDARAMTMAGQLLLFRSAP
ncbi:MAG TPA: hypothetical protein VIK18_19430, partial [Pirellulales bacterium]